MSAKTEIKNLFSNMLSPKIELNSTELVYDGEDIEKELFIQIIESWGNAWKQQNTLFNKYGIDLSGYDNLLYSSIEKSMILLFGHTKWQIINSYVYSSLDLEEDKLKIVAKDNKTYYISSPGELFDFVTTVDDEDLFEDNEEN